MIRKFVVIVVSVVFLLVISGCTTDIRFASKTHTTFSTTSKNISLENKQPNNQKIERGNASFYHDKFEGLATANGEVFSQKLLTAAHKTLPFGTFVKVTRVSNGKSVIVRINDRGPFAEGRIIDLSRAAAEKLELINAGVAEVVIEIIE